MKRNIVILMTLILAVATYGQSDRSQNKELYAFVIVIKSTDKTTATIDFGDGTPKMAFADEKGKKRKFETIFEPINLLIKKGWEVDKFSSMVSGVNLITHWVMKIKPNEEYRVKDGLKLVTD